MITRRTLLQSSLASIALIGFSKNGWGNQAWHSDPFTMGVASGSPTDSSIVLWTRLDSKALDSTGISQQNVDVTWQIARDERFIDIAAKGVAQAMPALGHSIHAEVNGLEPARQYFYRFMVGDAVSATGRTKTFPAMNASVDRLKLAYASCQQWGNGYYSAYRHMAKEDIDFVLFLGDYIYEYPASIPPVRYTPGGWITTLEDYRARYALHKSDPDLQAVHQAFPWVMTWDDHEVQNDYAGDFEGRSGVPVADFMARRRAAYQAYYENMPIRRATFAKLLASESMNAKLFDRVQFGQLANIFMLDDRQYRDRQVCNPDNRPGSSMVEPDKCAVWNDPNRTLLGSEQEQWLRQSFSTTQTQWNIIGQQSVFGQRFNESNGIEKLWNDGWDGYDASRRRMIDTMIATKLANPIMFGGDVHENWVGHIKADYNKPDSATLGVEFCGTSITSLSGMKQDQANKVLARNPHFVFADTTHRGYGVAHFSKKELRTTLKGVKDATDPASDIFKLAEFVVPTGRSELHQI